MKNWLAHIALFQITVEIRVFFLCKITQFRTPQNIMHKDSARDPDGAKMHISEDFTNKWVRLKNVCLVELQNQVKRETELKSNSAGF